MTTFDDEEGVSSCPASVAAVGDTVAVKAIDCSFLSLLAKLDLMRRLSHSQRKAPQQTQAGMMRPGPKVESDVHNQRQGP